MIEQKREHGESKKSKTLSPVTPDKGSLWFNTTKSLISFLPRCFTASTAWEYCSSINNALVAWFVHENRTKGHTISTVCFLEKSNLNIEKIKIVLII